MAVNQAALFIENEIAAQLQHICTFIPTLRDPAAEHQPQIAPHDPAPPHRSPRCALQSECPIRSEGRIGDHRKRQRLIAFIDGQHRRLGERDNQHFRAHLPNGFVMVPHVAEMRSTRDSAGMRRKIITSALAENADRATELPSLRKKRNIVHGFTQTHGFSPLASRWAFSLNAAGVCFTVQ